MSKYVKSWEKTLSVSQYHIKTLTGDALLTAACVCYLGPLGQETRDKLLRDWKIACLGSTGQSESENDDDSELDIENNATSTKELHQGLLGCSTSKSIPFIAPERIPVRRDFKLKEILSTEEELYCWRYSGLPVNLTAVENALMMRTICELSSRHWPLLIDTDLQSYMWIKCLHQTMDTKGNH